MSDADTAPAATRSAVTAALPAALLAVAALCLWAASRMTWVRVTSFDGLGENRTTDLIGGTWAAATTPLALVLLAAIAASFAVRGWALRIVAVLVAAVAVAAVVPAISLLAGGETAERGGRLADLPDRAEVTASDVFPGPALLVVVGAVAALTAAIALLRKASAAGGLSSRYSAPAARRAEVAAHRDDGEPPSQRVLWDALDAGDDPTDDDTDTDPGREPGDHDGSGTGEGTPTRR